MAIANDLNNRLKNAIIESDDVEGQPAMVVVNPDGSAVSAGGGGSAPTVADDAAFSVASGSVSPIGGLFDNTGTDSVDEGDAGIIRMSANRNLYVNIRDNAGNERGLNVDASGNITVNVTGTVTVASHAVTNAGTFVVQENGAALTALQLIDDAIYIDDADWTDSTSKHLLVGGLYQSSQQTITDGDVGPLQVDANGNLKVAIISGAGSGGTAAADDADFTAGTTNGTPAMGVYESSPTSVTDGDLGTVGITATRALRVSPEGAALTALQLIDDIIVADDAAFTPGTTKVAMFGAQLDNTGTDSVDEGDAGALRMSANRNLYVMIRDNAGNERGLNVDSSGNITVNVTGTVTVASHAVTNAGTFAVQVDGNALTALQLIDDTIFTDDAAFTPGTSKVSIAGFQADESSTDSVDEGDAGAARMTLDRKVIVNPQPHTAGGLSIFRSLDLDESEEDVKTAAGQVYGYWIANLATSPRYLKFYNATAANVTVGSTTPVMTLPIPANSTNFVAANLLGAHGIAFDTAISVAATTGLADADTGAPGANEVVVNIFYK